MCTNTIMCCNLCNNNNNKSFKLNEIKFLDSDLSNVIKNILAVHTIELSLKFRICSECSLALLQTEIVLKRLREAIIKENAENIAFNSSTEETRKSTSEDMLADGDEVVDNDSDLVEITPTTSTKQQQQSFFGAFSSETLLLNWTFYCTYCDYTAKKPKWFKRHLIGKHQLKHARIYQCPFCNESYERVFAIKTHIDCVHGNKPRPTRMRRKTILLSRNSNDENIEDETLADEKLHKCKKCSLKFLRKSTLDNHIARKHDGTKKKRRSSAERRKSAPANFEHKTVMTKEIEIVDVKDEEVSDAPTEVYLGTKELQIHQEVIQQTADYAKENVGSMDTLNNDHEKESVAEIDMEKNERELSDEDKHVIHPLNGQIEPNINDQTMVIIPVTVASNQERNTTKDFQSPNTSQKFRDTENDKEPKTRTQNADAGAQSYIVDRNNKFNLHSTPSIQIFQDTPNDEPLLNTQSDSEEHSNKLNLHSRQRSIQNSRDTPNDESLMDTESDCEEHINKSNVHATLSKTQSFPNDEPIIITQMPALTRIDSEENSSEETQTIFRNKMSLSSTQKKATSNDVDSVKSKNIEITQKMLSRQISDMEISKNDWVFLCSYCDFETKQRKVYKEHIKFEHDVNDENIYKCLYCTAAFVRYKSLKSHVSEMHAMHMTAKCQTPSISDSSQSDRKRKVSEDSIKEKESCAADTSASSEQLAKRKKLMSCVVCGKVFSSAEKLQNHITKLHPGDKMCQ